MTDKLQNLQIQIFKTASEYGQFFKQKVDNPNDSLKDYEITATIYLTREEDDLWSREVIILKQYNLEGLTYNKVSMQITEWILNANDHCDGGKRAPSTNNKLLSSS